MAVAGITTVLSVFIDKINCNNQRICQYVDTKKNLFYWLLENGIVGSALYASSPIAASLNPIYIPMTILLATRTLGQILNLGTPLTKNQKHINLAKWLNKAPYSLSNNICDGIDRTTRKIYEKIDKIIQKINKIKKDETKNKNEKKCFIL